MFYTQRVCCGQKKVNQNLVTFRRNVLCKLRLMSTRRSSGTLSQFEFIFLPQTVPLEYKTAPQTIIERWILFTKKYMQGMSNAQLSMFNT